MPPDKDLVSLQQMLDHAREVVDMVKDRTRGDLDTERVLSLALVQLMQLIGEAAGRVSPARQENHPEIQWPEIIALRNRLIHGYDTVDFDILWRIITNDIPPLISALERILS